MSLRGRSSLVSFCWVLILSGCSSDPPPLAGTTRPEIRSASPTSPGQSLNPKLLGIAEGHSKVRLYVTSDCSGEPLREGSSEQFEKEGLEGEASDNATTYFYAQSTNRWGASSECSEGYFYVHDTVPPEAPRITRTLPSSPSNSNTTPRIEGLTARQTVVTFYGAPNCSGPVLATLDVGLSDSFSQGFVVEPDSTHVYSATATDLAGNVSDCAGAVTYVHDPRVPSAPTLLSTAPVSPSSSGTPLVQGTADPRAKIYLFHGTTCAGSPQATANADAQGDISVAAQVEANTLNLFSALAQNAAGTWSACSNTLSYIHDAVPPGLPTFSSSDPASPSRSDFTPTLNGQSEPSSTVRLFRGTCTGAPVATIQANETGAFSVSVGVAANSATTFHAQAVDLAGNVSACSTSTWTYVHDDVAPSPVGALAVSPSAQSNSVTSPTISGAAEANGTVALYTTTGCVGTPVALVPVNASGNFAALVTVAANSRSVFRAVAFDMAGNPSACSSASITFTHDDIRPATPVISGTSPTSPGNEPLPTIVGTGEAGSTVTIFVNALCTGKPARTGTVSPAGTFSIRLNNAVPSNVASDFYAAATDGAGNASGCSAARSYTHDNIAPPMPTLQRTTPASPSPDNTPTVSGTAQPGAFVRLYTTLLCSIGSEITASPAVTNASGDFSVAVVVPANVTTSIYARAFDAAENGSGCTVIPLLFQHDGIAPDAPVITAISPSPSNSLTPTLTGTAPSGLTVRLYLNGNCTGDAAGSGVANDAGAFSLTALVPPNASSQVWARTVDSAGNASACSNASQIYTHDGFVPSEPSVTGVVPASPSAIRSPQISGSAEGSSTVRVYGAAGCGGAVLATTTATAGGSYSVPVTVPANVTTSLFVRATDAAGNPSACSSSFVSYTHDDVVPQPPLLQGTTPGSPGTEIQPVLAGTAEALSTVRIYRQAGCAGTFIEGTVGANGTFSIGVPVSPGSSNVLTARSVDAAGNVSACGSGAVPYVHDATAPAVPTFTRTTPPSPSNEGSPSVVGTAEANSTVLLYLSAGCSVPVTTGAAGLSGAFSINVPVNTNIANNIYARARDAAGNTSGCTAAPLVYVHDSIAPGIPTVSNTSPASPSNDGTPTVNGFGETGSVVRLFVASDCSGSFVAEGVVSSGAFHIDVVVPAGATRTFYAHAVDTAGNASACSTSSVSYSVDATPPSAPNVNGAAPPTPSSVIAPTIVGESEAGATVETFLNSGCTGAPAGMGTASVTGAFSVVTTVKANSENRIYARARDGAGNTSSCSSTFAFYVHDGVAPEAPVLSGSVPVSGSAEVTPSIQGSAESGSTVRLFASASCDGAVVGEGMAVGGLFSIPVTVASGSASTFYALATDSAGNISSCSSSFLTYQAGL
jgi:hypothetical protein